jgi:DNA-binding beta-propeller fold protein YncE
VKLDLDSGQITQTLEEPASTFAAQNYPTKDDYPHNSAHHGLSISGDGQSLCDVGTIDNTVSIVSTADLTVKSTTDVGLVPYWATTSPDGNQCFVSISGGKMISVIDFRTGDEIKRIPVETFPQRTRLGQLQPETIAALAVQ